MEKHGLTFPVLYGVDGRSVSQAWGSYYDPGRDILHATAFILGPDRAIVSATYSTGPIGRLMPQDALALVQFLKSRAT